MSFLKSDFFLPIKEATFEITSFYIGTLKLAFIFLMFVVVVGKLILS